MFGLQCKSEDCKNEVGQKEGLGVWSLRLQYIFLRKGKPG